jgi:thiamine transporter
MLAFCMMSLSALTRKMNNRAVAAGLGAFIGCVGRFVCHFISGCTVWGEYAQGWDAPAFISSGLLEPAVLPYTYSFTYNCIYMIPETILTVMGSAIICTLVFQAMKIDVNAQSDSSKKTV